MINQEARTFQDMPVREIAHLLPRCVRKFAIPVHGEYRHLMAQKKLAESMGIPKENVIIMSSGDVIEIGEEGYKTV